MSPLADVFTADEIARAAGVPREAVYALVAAGTIRPVPGTDFFDATEAMRAGTEARRVLRSAPTTLWGSVSDVFGTEDRTLFATRRGGLPTFASSLVHAMFVMGMLWLTTGSPASAPATVEEARLVFLARPGPGGGGGGGGLRNPLPPRKASAPGLIRRTQAVNASPDREPAKPRQPQVRPQVASLTPTPAPATEALPSRRLVAPVVATASGELRDGAIEQARKNDSLGRGAEGGTGSGRGAGDGEGAGAGIGPGSGGGTGGGPYRAGSGIDPPRLIREVKARYTEDARRLGTRGDVILEIVVNRDGTVGDVSVRRGLGAGLDQSAIEAVRQWRFAPARRLGEPVDVIVEVAVEFTLR
jgi:periplasmic protein TonB